MVFRLIDKDTMFNIEFTDKKNNTSVSHKGFLYEPARDIVLYIEGDALHDYCAALPKNTVASLVFYRGQNEFSFEGKYEGVSIKNGKKLTEITGIGVIRENSRRLTRRFDMSIDASLFLQKNNADIRAVCSGQTHDISCDSMSLWSNDNVEDQNALYYARFTLFYKDHFNLPAKMLKRKNAPPSSFFRYEYVFLFDFSSDQNEKKRLLDAFIKNSIEASRI